MVSGITGIEGKEGIEGLEGIEKIEGGRVGREAGEDGHLPIKWTAARSAADAASAVGRAVGAILCQITRPVTASGGA